MKLFSKVKEIRSKTGELHFERFAIIETSLFAVYIHRIHKEDKDRHLHSHPWNFFTVTLKGSYVERFLGLDLFGESQEDVRVKRPGSIAFGDRYFYHKIDRIVNGPVTTFFVTWGRPHSWFYFVTDEKGVEYSVESNDYRKLKHSTESNIVNTVAFKKD